MEALRAAVDMGAAANRPQLLSGHPQLAKFIMDLLDTKAEYGHSIANIFVAMLHRRT